MTKWSTIRIIALVMIAICIALLSCYTVSQATAQNSYVQITGESDGGYFNFTGSGAYWDWNIDLRGWDEANVDLTNHWGRSSSTVKYEDIGAGTIYVKVTERFPGDEMYYFEWKKLNIDGDGTYSPGGGRNVQLVNSTNVTGWIEYPERGEKAVFLFDTSHHEADLTVIVHNGILLENATVTLANGDKKVKWTDENGEAKFSPGTGTYHLIVEHENFSAMLVDELFMEADKSYMIRVNMTDCLTSKGVALCSPDADDLIVYYKDKDPVMGSISPQKYVNFFADRLRTCKGVEDNCADGTLERMATDWGIYPDPPLNVLLYDCNITDTGCVGNTTELEIEYTIKNYQQYECNYTVSLIYGNKTIGLDNGVLPKTWSEHSKITATSYVVIDGCEPTSTVYLAVVGNRQGDD